MTVQTGEVDSILFEKVRAPDARFQDITSQMYDDFKSKNGFNEKRDTAQNKITKRGA